MKKLYKFCLLGITTFALNTTHAQQFLNAEDGTTNLVETMTPFANGATSASDISIVDNPSQSGINTSNKVIRYLRRTGGAGAEFYAGFFAGIVDPDPDFTTNKYMHVKVYKQKVSPVLFKIEGGPSGNIEVGSTEPYLTSNTWQDMVFDFSGATGSYPTIVFFPDFEFPLTDTGDIFIYFDDIVLNNSPTPALPLSNNSLLPVYCNSTLDQFNSFVYSNLVPGAQAYRYRVTHSGTNEVQTLDYFLRNLNISSMSFFKYDQEYNVEVAVKKDNLWSNFGKSCTVKTPAAITQIVNEQCGITLLSRSNFVFANSVPKVRGYRFKVTNLSTNSVQLVDKVLRVFTFNSITDYQNGVTYSVEVAIINNDNSYSNFGASCLITTPGGNVSKYNSTNNIPSNNLITVGYPNPFNDSINLKIETQSSEDIAVTVYNLMGSIIESLKFSANNSTINIGSNYPTGIYIISLKQEGFNNILRIVKR